MRKLGIDALFNQIEELETLVKKKFPRQKGRVMIATAKQVADYEVGKEDVMKWAHIYSQELKKYL